MAELALVEEASADAAVCRVAGFLYQVLERSRLLGVSAHTAVATAVARLLTLPDWPVARFAADVEPASAELAAAIRAATRLESQMAHLRANSGFCAAVLELLRPAGCTDADAPGSEPPRLGTHE